MRVLWVDADDSPWTDANGWQTLEDFGLRVERLGSLKAATSALANPTFDLLLVRAELPGVEDFLVKARTKLEGSARRMVLASSTWTKEEFRQHSKTKGAAHRYARVPMPPEGFLNLVAELFGCGVDALASFAAPLAEPAAPAAPKKKSSSPRADTGDAEVLRSYLRIKEEQLEISETEREELSRENERVRKEAHTLQAHLREMEIRHEELNKKLAQLELARESSAQDLHLREEEREREGRAQGERVKALEAQLGESAERYESLRSRVRKDIRKIRENERELEARLELLRKDSATLLQARDEKVLEMQRKIDALEFDLDQVQDGRVQAQMEAERYLAKLSRVARALNVAVSMIEDGHVSEEELEELEPLSGGAALAEDAELAPPPVIAASAASPVDSMGSEAPSEEAVEELSDELAALANDGEATQMVDMNSLPKAGGDPE